MQVKIKNWRCIKEVEFDLSRINIFLGQNATGKSSLAYALYLLSKSPKYGCITTDDVRIYYFMRSKEDPWTTIKKIDVYEDGTLEELPDSEKITAQLLSRYFI